MTLNDQAKEKDKTTTAYKEEARMLEVKAVRSSMEQWGQAVSGSEKINLHSQLEKKQVELEVSVGQGEQTCMHDMTSSRRWTACSRSLSSQGEKENTTSDYEVEEGEDYEVQRGTEGAEGRRTWSICPDSTSQATYHHPGEQQQAIEEFTAEQSLPYSCRPLGGHGGGSQDKAEESVTGQYVKFNQTRKCEKEEPQSLLLYN